jgi:phosphopantetheinyl transferase (holo-ACP synthase)
MMNMTLAGCGMVSASAQKLLAEARGLRRWTLSISHDGGVAIAFVVAT